MRAIAGECGTTMAATTTAVAAAGTQRLDASGASRPFAASQSTIARATLDNADGQWRPGSAVRAMVTVSTQPAALVVPLSALQQMDGRDVVFVREGERYEKRAVTLGRRDARQVEIVDGVAVGEDVVIAQSYTIKADLEKAGAGHAH